MDKYIVVNFSGGKDSTAMLLRMIELGEHIDEVICCDTTMEFPAMYKHIAKVKYLVEDVGIKFTTLKADKDFEYLMLHHVVTPRNGGEAKRTLGYSWAGPRNRWCTTKLKTGLMKKHLKQLKKTHVVINCIGIAADETKRLERALHTNNQNHRYPLVEWGWTEKDALAYCNKLGYDWEGLYDIFDRVSCWCCPLQSLQTLRLLRKHFPDLWQKLKELDEQTWRKFKPTYSVADLDKRFDYEEACLAAGLPINTKKFYKDLKRLTKEG